MNKIDTYIDNASHLLPAPRIVPQLLQLLSKNDVDNNEIVALISYDPSLTANVLRISNSAYFGSASEISTLDEAVTRLGSKEVYRIVVAISGALVLCPPKNSCGVEANELLDHSVTSAVAAQIIAQDGGDDENLAFTSAILHDIGKIVVSAVSKNFYQWLQGSEASHSTLLEAEKKLLGVDHASLGGRILDRWKFPAPLVESVRHHHAPAGAGDHARVAAQVYLGNAISYLMGHGYGHQPSMPKGDVEALKILGISHDKLEDYIVETSGKLKSVKALLQINDQSPDKSKTKPAAKTPVAVS